MGRARTAGPAGERGRPDRPVKIGYGGAGPGRPRACAGWRWNEGSWAGGRGCGWAEAAELWHLLCEEASGERGVQGGCSGWGLGWLSDRERRGSNTVSGSSTDSSAALTRQQVQRERRERDDVSLAALERRGGSTGSSARARSAVLALETARHARRLTVGSRARSLN
jgi:hypothetical protein